MPENELEPFIDSDGDDQDEHQSRATVECQLLIFDWRGTRFAAPAQRVENVVKWHPPAPLPRSTENIQGVVQDQGTVVTVLNHPSGTGAVEDSTESARILICRTSRGHLGLPADVTVGVEHMELRCEPAHGSVVDTPSGVLTYIDPNEIVREMLQAV